MLTIVTLGNNSDSRFTLKGYFLVGLLLVVFQHSVLLRTNNGASYLFYWNERDKE